MGDGRTAWVIELGSSDADGFRTSDWYRPNSRAIREGVTPALKLPEWHLADTASMMAALLPVPGEMMAGRSGTAVLGAGCKIAAQT